MKANRRSTPVCMGRSIKLCAARSYPSSLLARSLALAVVSSACLSYRLDGDTVHLVALMGDTFTFEYSTVTDEHLDPSRLVVLEQDARMRPRHKARTGPSRPGVGDRGRSLEDGNPEGDSGTVRALAFIRRKIDQHWGRAA